MSGFPVVVLGGINMDLVVAVDSLPRPGETVLGGDMRRFGGGKGANQAIAAARMGATTHLVGRVGSDDFGGAILENLRSEGIGLDGVGRDADAPTGVALIGVDSSGDNSIIVSSGANSRVSLADLDAVKAFITRECVLVANLEVPVDVVMEAAERWYHVGATVVLNLAPAVPIPADLLEHVDVLVLNETEGATLAGVSPTPRELAVKLQSRGPRAVVLTVGSDGAWVAEMAGVTHVPADQVKAVDSTAAGDAFVGALAAELGRGASVTQACEIATAAGAIAVTRSGAQPSLPQRVEVERFLAERPQADRA